MKIYLAGRFVNKGYLQEVGDLLSQQGHEITSRWLAGDAGNMSDTAQMDLDDIYSADAIVLYADEPKEGERPMQGALVELGFAIALNKRIFVVNELQRMTVFFHLPQVNLVESWPVLFAVLDLVEQMPTASL